MQQVINFEAPGVAELVFHQDASHVRLVLGDVTDPVNLTGGAVTFRYSIDGETKTLVSSDQITVQSGAPTPPQTQIEFEIPAEDLVKSTRNGPANYILSVTMPDGRDPLNILAGTFWRRVWA